MKGGVPSILLEVSCSWRVPVVPGPGLQTGGDADPEAGERSRFQVLQVFSCVRGDDATRSRQETQPWRCLWRGFSQITMTLPWRRITLHLSQIGLTLGLTFMERAFLDSTELDGWFPPGRVGGCHLYR
jgi:hypothetical protein